MSLAPPRPPPPPTTTSRPPRTLRPGASNHKTSGIGGIATASTPNLSSLYLAHSRLAPPLTKKSSFSTLTTSSLATIPDASDRYALDTLSESPPPHHAMATSPFTPKAGAGDDISIGDTVDVPGDMTGTIRFIGNVQGKKGTFAGVELHSNFAARGKNNGDVDGVTYFSTTAPGAGIFLPLSKAVRRESPQGPTSSSFPMTPNMATSNGGLKPANQNSTNYTPPTPSVPKFSQSVGPGRAPSPLGKRPRTSLSRPESPMRKLQMTPAARPTMPTPSSSKTAVPRYGSPVNKFSQTVQGGVPAGDPNKGGMLMPGRKMSYGPRSASALSGPSGRYADDETTPVSNGRVSQATDVGRSVSQLRFRAPSRASSISGPNEEVEKLRSDLADRDRQLKEQTAMMADMESSLNEVQTLMEQADAVPNFRAARTDDHDAPQLRALLAEKDSKIRMLTAEFDQHRADFRETIDTLELASTETERVYEKRIDELMQEIHDIQDTTSDVDAVASQLKQLEELVQELEEGLEDARRGEAEARGEVEFLRGEVERTRSELRREREKAAAALNGTNGTMSADQSSSTKELEQKEDEIRGLKAIIHSLSRESVPDEDRPYPQRSASFQSNGRKSSVDGRIAREKLEREVAELRALLDNKNNREEEMEREMEIMRRGSATTLQGSLTQTNHSSARDSRDTIILAKDANAESGSPKNNRKSHNRNRTLDTMPESDNYSSVTGDSQLWCELCETSGHDILSCTNMFGSQPKRADDNDNGRSPLNGADGLHEGIKGLSLDTTAQEGHKPAPLSPVKNTPSGDDESTVRIMPNPMESGPVAGKESGTVDAGKWCALCERDGHDSVDCPFEDAF